MPTFIKTGFWDKLINNNPQKAKAPIGWLNLDKFVESKIPPPGGVNIYNSDGTLTGNRFLDGFGFNLTFGNLINFGIYSNGLMQLSNASTQLNIYNNQNLTINRSAGGPIALNIDFLNKLYQFGNILGNNLTMLQIDDANQIIKTSNQGNDIGLKLDFANNVYSLGDSMANSNGTGFIVDVQNYTIKSVQSLNDVGLKLEGDANFNLGDFNNINGGTNVNISNSTSTIKTQFGGNDIGLKLDFANSVYQLGQITGGNVKTFAIDDAAAFGFQFSGTGITQASTGAASGQYLKVKVGGNDYVIELKNPS